MAINLSEIIRNTRSKTDLFSPAQAQVNATKAILTSVLNGNCPTLSGCGIGGVSDIATQSLIEFATRFGNNSINLSNNALTYPACESLLSKCAESPGSLTLDISGGTNAPSPQRQYARLIFPTEEGTEHSQFLYTLTFPDESGSVYDAETDTWDYTGSNYHNSNGVSGINSFDGSIAGGVGIGVDPATSPVILIAPGQSGGDIANAFIALAGGNISDLNTPNVVSWNRDAVTDWFPDMTSNPAISIVTEVIFDHQWGYGMSNYGTIVAASCFDGTISVDPTLGGITVAPGETGSDIAAQVFANIFITDGWTLDELEDDHIFLSSTAETPGLTADLPLTPDVLAWPSSGMVAALEAGWTIISNS
jgi:hypothetical protein